MRRLGAAVEYTTPPAGNIRAVDVVYVDHASWLRSLVLFTGDRQARVDLDGLLQVLMVPDLVGVVTHALTTMTASCLRTHSSLPPRFRNIIQGKTLY